MFRVTAWSSTLPCDRHLTREVILKDFPDLALAPAPDVLWEQGINLLEDGAALVEANRLLAWCRTLTARRVCIVCHDGTIHFYRQLLTGRVVTRADFLGDAESIEVVLSEREPEEDGAIGG